MDPINVVAERLGIDEQHLIPFGNTKAKVSLDAIRENGQRGKLVVVTGITPHSRWRRQDYYLHRLDRWPRPVGP